MSTSDLVSTAPYQDLDDPPALDMVARRTLNGQGHVQPLFDHDEPRRLALFRVVNRYVGNSQPMPGVFPRHPASVIRNTEAGTEMALNFRVRFICL
jgi:hypothetical protein